MLRNMLRIVGVWENTSHPNDRGWGGGGVGCIIYIANGIHGNTSIQGMNKSVAIHSLIPARSPNGRISNAKTRPKFVINCIGKPFVHDVRELVGGRYV